MADGGGTTTEASSGAETSDGDTEGLEPACPLDCAPPCDLVLSEGLEAVASVHHDGTRFVARDVYGKLILRDAATLEVLHIEHDTAWAELAAGVLAVAYDDDSVLLRSAADLAVLGEAVTASRRGLAVDGSYLWAAGVAGVEVVSTDGSPVWSMAGDFTDAQVLALPDSLHVFADEHALKSVMHVDLDTGLTDDVDFEGMFAGWFGDAPRFWVHQGMAYRIYEPDGLEIAFGFGTIAHGFADHVVLNGSVVHVSDVQTPLFGGLGGWGQRSGPAFAASAGGMAVLDPAGPYWAPFAGGDPFGWRFAWTPSGWVHGRSDGVVVDQLGRTTSLGPIARVDAAIGGRFASTSPTGSTGIWDVVPDCTVEHVGELALPGGPHQLSPDGSVVTSSIPSPVFLQSGHGTLFQALPGGDDIAFVGQGSCSTCFIQRWSMSDDASVAAHFWSWTGAHSAVAFEVPSGSVIDGDDSNVLPAIAPDGAHVVVTDAYWGPGATYEIAVGYVHADGAFVDVFDGVAWGFVDDTRVLVSRYESAGFCDDAGLCDTFLGTDIVELDGTIVQPTTLPDVRAFQRISDTEIFAADPPRIFDVYTGELLWSMPDVEFAAAIGPDLAVWSDGASLVVHRWR